MSAKARLIAFYLPQYHPIPENDAWWGKGFTEWTNVAKAQPLFPGHYQPHLPGDLGYYDLRLPEVRMAQAELARANGIEGFCYWHYWFAGKRLLERPFSEVLRSKEPDFPFCLAWANASWTGIWYGEPDRVLVEQTYPGFEDIRQHFYSLVDAFQDDRYIKIDGKPVFMVFRSNELPNPKSFIDVWQELAVQAGLKGIYFIGLQNWPWDPRPSGFDAGAPILMQPAFDEVFRNYPGRIGHLFRKIFRRDLIEIYRKLIGYPRIIPYAKAIELSLNNLSTSFMEYPMILPNWDNTPRSGINGIVFHQSTPELFRRHLIDAIKLVENREYDKRVILVKSWNEWAEGNYLEPDTQFGCQYLNIIREENHVG